MLLERPFAIFQQIDINVTLSMESVKLTENLHLGDNKTLPYVLAYEVTSHIRRPPEHDLKSAV